MTLLHVPRYLVHCLQSELSSFMPAFLDDPEEKSLQRPKIGEPAVPARNCATVCVTRLLAGSVGLLMVTAVRSCLRVVLLLVSCWSDCRESLR